MLVGFHLIMWKSKVHTPFLFDLCEQEEPHRFKPSLSSTKITRPLYQEAEVDPCLIKYQTNCLDAQFPNTHFHPRVRTSVMPLLYGTSLSKAHSNPRCTISRMSSMQVVGDGKERIHRIRDYEV